MRIRRAMLAALLTGALSGCAELDKAFKDIPWGWPFRKKPRGTAAARASGDEKGAISQGWELPDERRTPAEPPTPPPGPRVTYAPKEPAPAPRRPSRPALTDSRPTTPRVRRPATGPAETRVIATAAIQVNRSYISAADLLRRRRKFLQDLPDTLSESGFRLKAARELAETLRTMVIEILVMEEAQGNLADPVKREIDSEVDDFYQEMLNELGGGSKKKLEHVLRQDGTELKTEMEQYRRRVTVREYLRARFLPSITINRRMLLDYFRRHREEFASPKKVQMQIIFVSLDRFLAKGIGEPTPAERQAARARAKAQIDEAQQALMSGEDFAEVAKRLSHGAKAHDGGLWSLMPAGSFRYKEVERAAFGLQEGKVSMPVETKAGFFIVKAKKVKPGKDARFEDAQVEIEKILRRHQYEKLTSEYFGKLLARATVGNTGRLVARAVDEAVERFWNKQT